MSIAEPILSLYFVDVDTILFVFLVGLGRQLPRSASTWDFGFHVFSTRFLPPSSHSTYCTSVVIDDETTAAVYTRNESSKQWSAMMPPCVGTATDCCGVGRHACSADEYAAPVRTTLRTTSPSPSSTSYTRPSEDKSSTKAKTRSPSR